MRNRVWTSQPQIAVPIRPELRPIAGINPGGFAFRDTFQGQALTIGSGVTRVMEPEGRAADGSSSNNGLNRALASYTDHPFSFIAVARCRSAGSSECLGSIATTADKTVRVFANATGGIFAQHIGATTNASATTGTAWSANTPFVAVGVFESPTMVRAYCKGAVGKSSASTTTNVGALGALNKVSFCCYDGSVKNQPFDGQIMLAQWFRYAFSDEEAEELLNNPWLIFQPLPRRLFSPSAATASHASSGDLLADAAVIAGTATHLTLHTSTGDLAAGAALVAGAATHPHVAMGALTADAAVIAGAAVHPHTTTGDLAAQAATVTGDATHTALGVHATSGDLVAGAATVVGTAAHLALHTTTGSLVAGSATVAGQATGPNLAVIHYGNLGWRPLRFSKKRRWEVEGLRQELADAINGVVPPSAPRSTPVKVYVPPQASPALEAALARTRRAATSFRASEEIAALREAIEVASVETKRQARRKRQQVQLLLM